MSFTICPDTQICHNQWGGDAEAKPRPRHDDTYAKFIEVNGRMRNVDVEEADGEDWRGGR